MKKFTRKFIISALCVLVALFTVVLPNGASYADQYQDGTYTVSFSYSGGSGRGGPADVQALVSGGGITTLYITMTSSNYDYCYDPVSGVMVEAPNGGGNSVFVVTYPGTSSFDFTADTTAMSTPHEITYTITLELSSIPTATSAGQGGSGSSGGAAAPSVSGSGSTSSSGSASNSSEAPSNAGSVTETPENPETEASAESEAKAVDDLIGKIGKVSKASKPAIEDARKAYDALSDEAKAKVTALSDLEKAEEEFAKLSEDKAGKAKDNKSEKDKAKADKDGEESGPIHKTAIAAGVIIVIIAAVIAAVVVKVKKGSDK